MFRTTLIRLTSKQSHRVPSIRFRYGKRPFDSDLMYTSGSSSATTTPESSSAAKPIKAGVPVFQHADVSTLPTRFRPVVMTEELIELINSGGGV
uniref:Uncharacterized protein n=1 Tax=Percolomonas cosmopolitus TaxID=63605 RepID=A0A7S1KMX0_9EUKA